MSSHTKYTTRFDDLMIGENHRRFAATNAGPPAYSSSTTWATRYLLHAMIVLRVMREKLFNEEHASISTQTKYPFGRWYFLSTPAGLGDWFTAMTTWSSGRPPFSTGHRQQSRTAHTHARRGDVNAQVCCAIPELILLLLDREVRRVSQLGMWVSA